MSDQQPSWSANEIVMVPVDEIVDYEGNAMVHPQSQIDELAAMMKSPVGFTIPCLLDGNKVLVAGHGRKKAGIQAGYSHIPCIIRTDLSPDEVRAFRIFDNEISRKGKWDLPKLNTELTDLGHRNFDLKKTGFSLDDIGTMMLKQHKLPNVSVHPPAEADDREDDLPPNTDREPRERELGYEPPASKGLSVVPAAEGSAPIAETQDSAVTNEDQGEPLEMGHPPGGQPLVYKSIFEVVIECEDEAMQKQVYEKFAQEGYKCRVLSM